MHNDKISDFATRIRNASLVGKTEVTMKKTKLLKSIADVMVQERYLEAATTVDDKLIVTLKYVDGAPALNSIKRISKPGMRVYKKSSDLGRILSGLGVGIISTSQGVMSDKVCKKQKLGGEVLLELW